MFVSFEANSQQLSGNWPNWISWSMTFIIHRAWTQSLTYVQSVRPESPRGPRWPTDMLLLLKDPSRICSLHGWI